MDIRAGETVIFVGPSGCGKSTTLKMINRLIEPTGGRIRIDGEDVTDMDPVRLRRKIGYAIQASGRVPHMTVGQDSGLGPKMLRWPGARVRARGGGALDRVGGGPGAGAPQDRVRDPGQRAVPAHDGGAEHRPGAEDAPLAGGPRAGPGGGDARPGRPRPGRVPRPLSAPAVRRPAAARGGRPGAGG